jgi:hypothetical protein
MKKLLLVGLSAVVLATGVFAFNLVKTNSAEAAAPCAVTVDNNKAIKVSADGKTASVGITVTGDCVERYATLVSWKSPSASGHPLTAQKLYKYTTKKLTAGHHTLTVALPDCYYQIDLLGQKRPTSLAGDANYDAMGSDVLVNFKLGGNKTCTPPPTPEKCPIPGMENLPKNDPDCKVPETPVTPETPVSPKAEVVTNATITDTGPGAIAAIASTVTAFGSGVAHFVLRRKD